MAAGTVGSYKYLVAGLGQGRGHQIQPVAHAVHTHELNGASVGGVVVTWVGWWAGGRRPRGAAARGMSKRTSPYAHERR